MTVGKRMRAATEKVDRARDYGVDEGFGLVKECGVAKFDESVDVCIKLGVDVRKGDQMVRGAASLPHGLGREVRIAAFVGPDKVSEAKDAGADAVGLDDLIESAKSGDFPYDVVVATPDVMSKVAALGQILGPRGLMPNPKMGTVGADIGAIIEGLKKGRAMYRTDKGGIVHCSIGRASFSADKLSENLRALIDELMRAKPSSVKGVYIRKVSVSTTMGPGVKLDVAGLGV